METYQVTVRLYWGSLNVEVEFEDDFEPTDLEIHDAAVKEIEETLPMSKLDWYYKIPQIK